LPTKGPLPPGKYKSRDGHLLFVQEDGQVHGDGKWWQKEPFNPMWDLLHRGAVSFTLIQPVADEVIDTVWRSECGDILRIVRADDKHISVESIELAEAEVGYVHDLDGTIPFTRDVLDCWEPVETMEL